MLERGNDVALKSLDPSRPDVIGTYGNGQLWPDIQRLLDGTFTRTDKSQMQAAW